MFSVRPIESAVIIDIGIQLAIPKLLKEKGLTAGAMLYFHQNDELSAVALGWHTAAATIICSPPVLAVANGTIKMGETIVVRPAQATRGDWTARFSNPCFAFQTKSVRRDREEFNFEPDS
jgi:hypothetical protein